MADVRRIYVEKKDAFAVKAKELQEDLKNYLGMTGIDKVRVLIRYDVENISEETFQKACKTVSVNRRLICCTRSSSQCRKMQNVFL